MWRVAWVAAALIVAAGCSRSNPDYAGGADLGVGDLAGVDLTGADLAGADLTTVDLAGADLTPPPYHLSIADTSTNENDVGLTTMTFTVTVTPASPDPITFDYATADGTARTDDSDYLGVQGRVTIPPGTTTLTLEVPVLCDTLDEINEQFTMTISNPINAGIARATATATITDDDLPPDVSVDDAAGYEVIGQTVPFRVWLSGPSGRPVTVTYSTMSGTASTGDYTSKTGTLTFMPGDTEKQVSVSITPDITTESPETFSLQLSAPVNVAIANATATGTIYDDDSLTLPVLTTTTQMAAEGNAGATDMTFTITTILAVPSTVTFHVATRDIGATAGDDYTAIDMDVQIPMGMNSVDVKVPILGDTLSENNEDFVLVLSAPTGATIGTPMVLGRIKDDDEVPSISFTPVGDKEGNVGSHLLDIPVFLSAAAGRDVTFRLTTMALTATAIVDYATTTGIVRFPTGADAWDVAVPINGDTIAEANETFRVVVSMPVNSKIGGNVTCTIQDDD